MIVFHDRPGELPPIGALPGELEKIENRMIPEKSLDGRFPLSGKIGASSPVREAGVAALIFGGDHFESRLLLSLAGLPIELVRKPGEDADGEFPALGRRRHRRQGGGFDESISFRFLRSFVSVHGGDGAASFAVRQSHPVAKSFPATGILKRTIVPLLSALLLIPGCGKKIAAPAAPVATSPVDRVPGFWIWHRSSPLSVRETAALAALGRPRLYRQIVEFGWRDGQWRARPLSERAPELPAGTLPVVRLDPGAETLERPDTAGMLAKWLRFYFPQGHPDALQLDYDCPVRLLPQYAAMIAQLRRDLGLKEISVTALASWISAPELPALGRAVEEMVPMFYDMTPDGSASIKAGFAVPMAGAEAAKWIALWKDCRTPWRAGLPDFERLSLFDPNGSPAGHLRQWSPEDLLDAAVTAMPATHGGAFFRIDRDAGMRGTALHAGQVLVWRAPGDDELRAMIAASVDAGARGVVWFALPVPGLRAHHSPAHLAELMGGRTPQPSVRAWIDASGRVILRNDGPGDLSFDPERPPHSFALFSSGPGAFGISGPGGFYRLSEDGPRERCVKSVLSFTELQGGAEIASESGLITSGEGRELRWSLDDSPPSPLPSP
ncbi:MAG: hypothetical protein JWO82_735 [Akkermansiaceae bacterium]|nr:hypothetical protein [Akkermansiaceae bacterium]